MKTLKRALIGIVLTLVVIIAAFKLIMFLGTRKAVKLCESYSAGTPFSATTFSGEFRDAKIQLGTLGAHALLKPGTPISYWGVDLKRPGFEDPNTLKQIDASKMEGSAHFTEIVGFQKYTCDINFADGKSTGFTFRWWD